MKTILLIEDNNDHIKLMTTLLEFSNYKVFATSDSEDGINFFKDKLPDLVILDLQLPKKSGFEIAQSLKKISTPKKIPIIAVSAYSFQSDREKAFESGCDAFYTKTINTREFPGIIKSYLETE